MAADRGDSRRQRGWSCTSDGDNVDDDGGSEVEHRGRTAVTADWRQDSTTPWTSTAYIPPSQQQQELSYRKHIARQLRTQYVEGIYSRDLEI